jgi:hypothetical protein
LPFGYIVRPFCILEAFFHILVCCTKKNLATPGLSVAGLDGPLSQL